MFTLYNPALLAGTMLFASLAGYSTLLNIHAAGDWQSLSVGTLISLGCGLVAIGSDLQASVSARLGAFANTSILQCWQGVTCLFGWGAFSVFMFQVVQLYPDWANHAFNFEVSKNPISTGLLVGVSAVIIIRSKLTKVNGIEWGAEWIYLWSGAQVIDAVNRRRVAIKKSLEASMLPHASDIAGHPLFYINLETHVNNLLPGKSADVQGRVSKELSQLRASLVPPGAPDPDLVLNNSAAARKILISIVIDYLGDDELRAWAKENALPI